MIKWCILAILAALAARPVQSGELDGAQLYDAYTTRDGHTVHFIVSDNATPADQFDDWLVDWEYLD